MIEMAVVGLGSWGLCVLERTVAIAARSGTDVRVHLVEPSIGGGIYSTDQPDYLILNNACRLLSAYASPPGEDEPAYAVGLYRWAVERGYRWQGHECRIGGDGPPIQPGDYLPRRLMGEYLMWFYEALIDAAPPNLDLVRHVATAVDITAGPRGRERVCLDNGACLEVDHVVLTSGHTWNAEPDPTTGPRLLRPYPVQYLDVVAGAGVPVAVAGMGLVAFDLLAGMTLGRGGRFEAAGGNRLRYRRSGREPVVHLYSRSGVPYCVKSADDTGAYEPVVCTQEAFTRLTHPPGCSRRRQVDFRTDLLPLVLAEMAARYHIHTAGRRAGPDASSQVRARLVEAWAADRWDKEIALLEDEHGRFRPEDHLFAGDGRRYRSGDDYQAQLTGMVESDLDEALTPGGSPVKAAQEVTRILRDRLRSVIDFGGLTLESYLDFQANVRGRINRLEAGPPPLRSQQLLALLDAGVVRAPFGPDPELTVDADGKVVVRSTHLDQPSSAALNVAVRGHLDMPSLARSASPLLQRLYATGRLTQLSYGEAAVGSVAIDEEFHPYDADGRVQRGLSLLGVLTEGVRYFTTYLPSPQSRIRAVLDAQACVEAVLS
jgi:hypothetical protein